MTGIKLGDRFLQIGCTDASLAVAIGSKAGMSGRACVLVDTNEDASRARHAAERGGVLLEVEQSPLDRLPYDPGSFDLIVVDSQLGLLGALKPETRTAALQQARRALAPRGRIVIIERTPRAGLGALFTRAVTAPDPHYVSSGGAATALKAEGFKAVRQLAERDGLSFFEGIT